MFDGFTLDRIPMGEVTLRVRYGGHGPPVVLLHGHPRTHTTWHRVAPRLAESPDRQAEQAPEELADALRDFLAV